MVGSMVGGAPGQHDFARRYWVENTPTMFPDSLSGHLRSRTSYGPAHNATQEHPPSNTEPVTSNKQVDRASTAKDSCTPTYTYTFEYL